MGNVSNIFKYGTVVDVNDEFDGDRIRVYVKGVDPAKFNLTDIPYAFPLIPKTLYTKPKVGETVLIFSQNDNLNDDRFWVGPLISQPHKIDIDTITAQAFLNAGLISPDIAPSTDPENVGVGVGNDDVALQGRGSTDVVVKPNEIRIRAGKTLDMRKLNIENPTYVQVKYDRVNNQGSVNIVSDYINLLSHKSVDKFNLSDPNDLINSEDYAKILEKAHQLPFGDTLIDFMNIFIKAFTTHVHAYAGLPPDLSQVELKMLLAYQLDKILSKNIRIN